MRRHYQLPPPPSQTTPTPFHPMYLTRTHPTSPSALDLSFDCTSYQSQFPSPSTLPLDRHIFQTIFLNRSRDHHLWTDSEIDRTKILRRDEWHQLCHAWTHYVLVVPWLWLLQGGRRRTRFAGSWTVVNAHETAVLSGIAAAVDLGAGYPGDLEEGDGFALMCFRMYYLLVYGRWYRKRQGGKGEEGRAELGTGVGGSVYCGPGVGGVPERGMGVKEREGD